MLALAIVITTLTVSYSSSNISSVSAAEQANQIVNISTISNNVDARTHTTYLGRMTGISFQDSSLVTYKGYQYATYWNNDRYLVISCRKFDVNTGVGGSWQEITLNYQRELGKNWTDDAHNTSSLGISKDGAIHLSFDMHDQPLNYIATEPGFCDDASKWSKSAFIEYYKTDSLGKLGKIKETGISYPRFIDLKNGDMLFEFRQGNSSCAYTCLFYYSCASHSWSRIGAYLNSIPGMWGYGSDKAMYCPYINGISSYYVNGKERLYVTWCWRNASGNSANHYLMTMHSDDMGRNWYNESNQLVSVADSNNVLNHDRSSSVMVHQIEGNNGVDNQTTQWTDDYGIVHALVSHTPTVNKANMTYTEDIFYYHYWRNTDGSWKWEPLMKDDGSAPVMRPSTMFYRPQITSYGKKVYAMCNDLEVHKGTPNDDPSEGKVSGYTWSTVYQNYGYDQMVEPTFDRVAIKNGMLSVAMLGPEIDTRKKGTENSEYVRGHWMAIDINLNKVNGRVSNKNIFGNGGFVGDDNVVFDADRSLIYPRNCQTDKEVDVAFTTGGSHAPGSSKNLSIQRNFGYGQNTIYFDGDFRTVAQKSTGFKFWVAGDSNAVLNLNQNGGVSMGFLCNDGYVYATTNYTACTKDITTSGAWYEIDWNTTLNKYKAKFAATRSAQFIKNNPNYNNGLPSMLNSEVQGSVKASSITSKIIGVYIVFGNGAGLWNEGAIGSKVYIDDVQFTGYHSDIIIPTTTKGTEPTTQPTKSTPTQPTQSTTKTDPTQPISSDIFMPANKWEGISSGGSSSVSGNNITANWTSSAAEYTLYDYNYHTSVNLPSNTKAIKFTIKINSVGKTNVPLEIYAGGNKTALGKYSGTFIDLGTGADVVGKTLTFTYNLSDFAGGAGGAESRALTVNQLKNFSPFEFRVRADDMTTAFGGINFTLSDIEAVTDTEPTTTKATTTTTKATTTTTSPTPSKKGDVNGDGVVNALDLQMLLKLVTAGKEGDKATCDMNNDGKVDILDVRALLSKIL